MNKFQKFWVDTILHNNEKNIIDQMNDGEK